MIVRGQIGPEELTAETLKDPEILRISTATELIDDPHLTQISEGKTLGAGEPAPTRWAQLRQRATQPARRCRYAP
jgi:hypothetical protein